MTARIELLPAGEVLQTIRDEVAQAHKAVFSEELKVIPQWAKSEWMILTFEGDQWVNVVELFTREIVIGGRTVESGGIGGVFTPPEQRGKGYAQAAVRRGVDFLCEQGADVLLLVCGDHRMSLYESLGWQKVSRTVLYRPDGTHSRLVPSAFNVMYITCDGATLPEGDIDYCGLLW